MQFNSDLRENLQLSSCNDSEAPLNGSLEGMSHEELLRYAQRLEAAAARPQIKNQGYERVYLESLLPTLIYDSRTTLILDANDSALNLYRYEHSQLLLLTLKDLFHSRSRIDPAAMEMELRKQVSVLGPMTHRTAQNAEVIVSMISLPAESRGENARVAIIHDETRRHSAEDALRTSEERYRELFENANDVIFLHDLQGRMIAINRAAEYLTGYTREEVIGERFELMIAPEARHEMQDSIRAHLGGSAAQHYELPILSKDGKIRFLEVSTRVIYKRGHPVAVQGIGRDVTERKLAQQRLEENAQELQRKNEELSTALRLAQEATQLKEQFLANTSHELRTPMNGIMGMINLLKSTDLDVDQREYADVVSQCANDLLTIINDLLDMSQIEAGKLSLTLDDVNLQESVRSVVKLLSVRAEAKGLSLTSELDSRLPPSVKGDSVRFRQILTNLLANALKFTAAGKVHVRLALSSEGQNIRCEVQDTGIGVKESVQERIFEAFFQADGTTRRRFGGTGLGLAISKQLVEIMGGRIGTYNHQPGPGATFWFELPVKSDESEIPAQESVPVQ